MGRAVLHVRRGRRPLLAAPPAGLAGWVRARRRRHARAGRDDGEAPVPHDHRAPPVALPLRVEALAWGATARAPARGGVPRGAGRARHGRSRPAAATETATGDRVISASRRRRLCRPPTQSRSLRLRQGETCRRPATDTPGRRPGLLTVSPSAAGGRSAGTRGSPWSPLSA